MAGNVTGLHRFADDVGPIPLALLDQNYDALTGTLNNLGTFSNFFVDTGTTNALTVTPAPAQTVSYSDGLVVQVRVAATNTGPATINIGGLGPQAIQTASGAALTGGELQAGSIVNLVYNASRNAFQLQAAGGGGGPGTGTFTTPFTVNSTTGQPLMEVYTPVSTSPAGQGIFEVTGPAVQGPSGYLASFSYAAPPTAGDGNGVWIAGGTNVNDVAFQVFNAAHTLTTPGVSFFQIKGDGSGSLGAAPNQLVWNTAGNFTLTGSATLPGGGSGGVSYLSQLLDVHLTSPVTGQVLTWNGTTSRWTNQALPSVALASLSDVAVSGPVQGQALTWNATTSKWTNTTVSGGGGGGTGGPFTTPFVVNDTGGQAVMQVLDGAAAQQIGTGIVAISPGNGTDPAVGLSVNGAQNYDVLHVNGSNHTTAGWWLAQFTANSTVAAGMSNGIKILAGTNSSDFALEVQNTLGNAIYFAIHGDGSGSLGISTNSMTWNTNGFIFNSTVAGVAPLSVVIPPATTSGIWLWQVGGSGVSGSSPGCSNGLQVSAGTNSSDAALIVNNDGATKNFMKIAGDGSGALGPAPNQLVWNSLGAFTLTGSASLPGGSGGSLTPPVAIGPPATAVTCMTVNAAVNATALVVNGGANTAGTEWLGNFLAASGSTAGFANGIQIQAGTNATDSALKVASVGGTTIMNVRGDGTTVHRYAPQVSQGMWMLQVGGGTTGNATNCSNGIYVGAGTSVNDCPLWVQNDAGSTTYLQILGDGTGALGPGASAMKWDSSGSLTMAAGARIIGLIFPVVFTLANVTTVPIGVNFMATAPFTIPANFAASRAYAQTGPAAAQTWNIRQYVGGTAPGTLIGTLTFAINATSGVFSSSSATTLSSGDVLALIPTTDTAMAGISVNIWTTRA